MLFKTLFYENLVQTYRTVQAEKCNEFSGSLLHPDMFFTYVYAFYKKCINHRILFQTLTRLSQNVKFLSKKDS